MAGELTGFGIWACADGLCPVDGGTDKLEEFRLLAFIAPLVITGDDA